MKKHILLFCLFAVFLPLYLSAQASPDDPAIQEAKAETAVVFDLGRFFGYLNTMEKESPELALSKDQLQEIYTIMSELIMMKRIEPDEAEAILIYLEDDVLNPDQLMEADMLAIAKMDARKTPQNSGSGGGQITSYIAGGPFNPMTDPSKNIGKDFDAFYKYVTKRLDK